jgi:hypothetical protein
MAFQADLSVVWQRHRNETPTNGRSIMIAIPHELSWAATIRIAKGQEGQPKAVVAERTLVFSLSKATSFCFGTPARCLCVIPVASSPDKKPAEHEILVQIIRKPSGKSPIVLTAERIVLADGETGKVVVMGPDGSETEVEATVSPVKPTGPG